MVHHGATGPTSGRWGWARPRHRAAPLAAWIIGLSGLTAQALGCRGFELLDDPEGRARDVPMRPAPTALPPGVAAPGVAAPGAWDPATTHAVIVGVLSFADPSITPVRP